MLLAHELVTSTGNLLHFLTLELETLLAEYDYLIQNQAFLLLFQVFICVYVCWCVCLYVDIFVVPSNF